MLEHLARALNVNLHPSMLAAVRPAGQPDGPPRSLRPPVQPVVLIGGRAAGTWRLTRVPGRARRARLTVHPFTALPAASADGLAAEAADIGRFLGVDVALETVET